MTTRLSLAIKINCLSGTYYRILIALVTSADSHLAQGELIVADLVSEIFELMIRYKTWKTIWSSYEDHGVAQSSWRQIFRQVYAFDLIFIHIRKLISAVLPHTSPKHWLPRIFRTTWCPVCWRVLFLLLATLILLAIAVHAHFLWVLVNEHRTYVSYIYSTFKSISGSDRFTRTSVELFTTVCRLEIAWNQLFDMVTRCSHPQNASDRRAVSFVIHVLFELMIASANSIW